MSVIIGLLILRSCKINFGGFLLNYLGRRHCYAFSKLGNQIVIVILMIELNQCCLSHASLHLTQVGWWACLADFRRALSCCHSMGLNPASLLFCRLCWAWALLSGQSLFICGNSLGKGGWVVLSCLHSQVFIELFGIDCLVMTAVGFCVGGVRLPCLPLFELFGCLHFSLKFLFWFIN